MKTTKRQFLKSVLAAIPLSKVVDIEESNDKAIAKKEQEIIDQHYRGSDCVSGVYAYTGVL